MIKIKFIVFSALFLLFNHITTAQTLRIIDTGENSTNSQNWRVTGANPVIFQTSGTAEIPVKLIENYLNKCESVVIKHDGNVRIDAMISTHADAELSLTFILGAKGNVEATHKASILSKTEKLHVYIQTEGSIEIPSTFNLQTMGGNIHFQAYEQTDRMKRDAQSSINISGKLNASGPHKGGRIILESDAIQLHESAQVLAQGALGGGNILIGGDWQGGTDPIKKESIAIYEAITVHMEKGAVINASATSNGDGGKVVLWSNLNHPRSAMQTKGHLLSKGSGINGKGGMVETSGGSVDFEGAVVSTLASNGSAGEWLIDPWNFVFNSTQLSSLASNLSDTNIIISTANNSASGSPTTIFGSGHIVFGGNLSYTGGAARTLTLNSNADIWIQGNINASSGSLSLIFNAPSSKRILVNGDITTNGGLITVNDASTIHFQKTSGTQSINSNGGAINFGNSNIRLLRHTNNMIINSGNGSMGLGGSGSVEQVNTFFDISATNLLSANGGWGGAHVNGSKTYGINVVSGREYSTRLYFWDSWDNERGELVVNENNTFRYYFTAHRTINGGGNELSFINANYGTQHQIVGPSPIARNSTYTDVYVNITFVAQHSGALTTWNNLNEDDNNESLEIFNFWETSFPTTTYSSGSRSLELITTTGQLRCSTKNFTGLNNLTFNTNNDWGFTDGIISGTTNVIKSGTGRVRFSGETNYTGTTTVNAGTFRFGPTYASNKNLTGNFINNGTVTYETGNTNNRPTIFLDGTISGTGTWNISSDVAPASIYNNRFSFRGTTNTSGQINITAHGNLWLEGSNINITSPIFLNGTNTRMRFYAIANTIITTGQITGTGTVDFADGGGGKNLTLAINTGSNNHQFDGIFANSGVSSGPTVLNIRKGGTGTYTLTSNNTYTGTTNITGTLVLRNNAPTSNSTTYQGTGQFRIEPASASFSSAFSTSGWSLSSTLTQLRVGKEGNTANITLADAITIAGPIEVYGGTININENLNTTTGGTNGSMLLKGSADITLSPSKELTTNNAPVILWANSDGEANNGAIILQSDSAISTNGGHVWLGGGSGTTTWNGLTVGDGAAVPGTTVTVPASATPLAAGILLNNCSIQTDGGNMALVGNVPSNGSVTNSSPILAGIISYGTTILDAGSGNVNVSVETSSTASWARGMLTGPFDNITYPSSFFVKSSSNATNAITISVNKLGNSTFHGLFAEGNTSIISSGTGGIQINATAAGSGNGIRIPTGAFEVLSASGPISVNSGTTGISFNTTQLNLGSKTGSEITFSSANITLEGNTFTGISPFTDIATSGVVHISPLSNSSFASALNTNIFNFSANISGFTIGRESNTANVTIGTSTSIAGPITIFGGAIAINAATTATSSDINLHASGAVTQSAALTANRLALNGIGTFTLQNSANNVNTIAGGDATTRLGNIAYRDADALEIGSVNPTGIFSTGTVLIETENGNLTLSQNIYTTATSEDAIILNAGRASAPGTAAGGDIIVSGTPTLSFGNGGIAKLFSGYAAAPLTALAGTGNSRLGVDETSSFSPALEANNTYALYRLNGSNITVVSSGGESPSISNGVLRIDGNQSINLSVITDYLSANTSLSIEATGNISFDTALTATGDLTIIADADGNASGDISFNEDVTAASLTLRGKNTLVAAGKHLNVSGNLLNDTDLLLDSRSNAFSSLKVGGAVSGTGDLTYSRYVNATPSNDLIAAPFAGMSFSDMINNSNPNTLLSGSIGGQPGFYLFGPHNEQSNSYEMYNSTTNANTPLTIGKGYRAGSTDGGNLNFTVPSAGYTTLSNTITVGIANTGEGWNLVGNPYPTYLALSQVYDNNENNLYGDAYTAIYAYNGNATNPWTIYNGVTGTNVKIAPGQAFFVRAADGGSNFSFTPSMQSTSGGDDFIQGRNTADTAVYHAGIALNSSIGSYTTEVYFHPNGSNGLDVGYDAASWQGSTPDYGVYSHLVSDNQGLSMAIQTLHNTALEQGTTIIPLGVEASSGHTLSLGLTDNSHLPESALVYLEDRILGSFTNLRTGSYSVSSGSGMSGTGRFYIHASNNATLSTKAEAYADIQVYAPTGSGVLVVTGVNEPGMTLRLYDLLGRTLVHHKLSTGSMQELPVATLSTAAVIVRLEGAQGSRSIKLIINP